MSEWEPYPDNRLIKRVGKFVIIKPVESDPVVPICCPLCDTMMRSRDDVEAFIEFECCHFCALQWAHPRRQAWHDGWRPALDEVKRAVAERPPLQLVMTD
jgi:hypothetical protein